MFKKKKKNKIEEILKNHNQSIQELQNQVKVLQHTIRYGVDGIEINLYAFTDFISIFTNKGFKIQVKYIHENKVCTAITTVKKEIYEKYERGTNKIKVLFNSPKYIIFELRINDRGVIQTYTYIIDKEANAVYEYPQIEVVKNE